MASNTKGLLERISADNTVIIAEGYLFEAERRGYLQAGAFVPEVVLERPQLVSALYEEFAHAGSDVVLALTYYSHREKLRLVGKEHLLEEMNREALKLARQIADKTGALMAGNICNTTVWKPDAPEIDKKVHDIFKEQIEWARDEGADFILAESFEYLGEAVIALECIKKYGNGLPAMINVMAMEDGVVWHEKSMISAVEGLKVLEAAGADVVGLNCHRGPSTMIPVIQKIKENIKIPVACIPVPYRTSTDAPGMQLLKDKDTGLCAFPDNLEAWLCSRIQIAEFTKQCTSLGVEVVGLCCGNMPCFTRTMAEALGRQPPASKYSPDMRKHLSQAGTESYKYAQEKNWNLNLDAVQ